MKALAEHHELFLYADRIEIPAFITAVEFLQKKRICLQKWCKRIR